MLKPMQCTAHQHQGHKHAHIKSENRIRIENFLKKISNHYLCKFLCFELILIVPQSFKTQEKMMS